MSFYKSLNDIDKTYDLLINAAVTDPAKYKSLINSKQTEYNNYCKFNICGISVPSATSSLSGNGITSYKRVDDIIKAYDPLIILATNEPTKRQLLLDSKQLELNKYCKTNFCLFGVPSASTSLSSGSFTSYKNLTEIIKKYDPLINSASNLDNRQYLIDAKQLEMDKYCKTSICLFGIPSALSSLSSDTPSVYNNLLEISKTYDPLIDLFSTDPVRKQAVIDAKQKEMNKYCKINICLSKPNALNSLSPDSVTLYDSKSEISLGYDPLIANASDETIKQVLIAAQQREIDKYCKTNICISSSGKLSGGAIAGIVIGSIIGFIIIVLLIITAMSNQG